MAYLLLILATLYWSGKYVLEQVTNEIIPSLALAFWQWTGAV